MQRLRRLTSVFIFLQIIFWIGMASLVRLLKRLEIVRAISSSVAEGVTIPSCFVRKRNIILLNVSGIKKNYTKCEKVDASGIRNQCREALDTDENSFNSRTICSEIERNGQAENSDSVISTDERESPGRKALQKYNLGTFEVTSFPPTFNFAAYVNDSQSLQELVKLGVNLYKWEKRKGVLKFILQRDFFRDMAPYVRFLHDIGVPADNLGIFLTKNPFIFKEDFDDLTVRINYLESKNFTQKMIARIVTTNPFWLMFSTKRIDQRLGHFQTTFKLSGDEVRHLVLKQANLITYNMHHIKTSTFVLREELGVTDKELKALLLNKPRLWIIDNLRLKNRFEYVHLEMKIPHELILKNPEILTSREFRIKERHLFLKSLKRDQYDPTLEGYIPLKSLVVGTNAEFAVNVAKTSVDTFNMFLKSL